MANTLGPRAQLLSLVPSRAVIAEIGVHLGEFSKKILKATQPKKLVLIDPWKIFDDPVHASSWYGTRADQEEMDRRHQGVLDMFEAEIAAGQVEVMRALSAEAAANFPDEYFDLVYVDGDHAYEGVSADLRLYFPKLKRGGLLAGDDYAVKSWWGDGVVRAFNELVGTNKVHIEMKRAGQIVLRKV